MNSTVVTLILSVIIGLGLTIGGAYVTIDNLIEPQGYLFEGIVLTALGVMLGLMVTIALSIGKTIMTFGEIMKNQADIQKQLRDSAPKPVSGGPLSSFLSSMLQNPGANKGVTIDFSDPDAPNSLKDLIKKYPEGSLDGLGIDDLEKELAKAVETDDYERAKKINKRIKKLKNLGEDDQEENNEDM